MALPIVNFEPTAASGMECAVALTKEIIAGQLDDSLFADPNNALNNVARVREWLIGITTTPTGVLMLTDPQGEQALVGLSDSLGKALGTRVQALGRGGGVLKSMLLQQLMEWAMKFAEEWFTRTFGGAQPQ